MPTRRLNSDPRPVSASSSRPVSFCPMSTPKLRQGPPLLQPSVVSNHRRFSELPIQLDVGFSFGEDATSALTNDCHYSSPDLRSAPQIRPLLSAYCGSSFASRGSTDRAIPSIYDSSSAFTAPTSPADDSDSVSCMCDDTVNAFDFPEPPPIGSPVIRRMRSSPWFLTADEADDVIAGWRGRAHLAAFNDLKQVPRSTPPPRPWAAKTLELQGGSWWSHASENDGDLERHSHRCDALGFRKNRPPRGQMHQTLLNKSELGLSTTRNSTLVDVQGLPVVVSKAQSPRNVDKKTEKQSDTSPFGRLPRIIRKVASMRSETQRALDLVPGAVQRPVPKVRSFRSLLRASEEQAQKPKRESWHLHKDKDSRVRQNTSGLSKPRRQSISQRHLSGDDNFYTSNSSSRTLAPSSSCAVRWRDDLDKSFIDISPERRPKSKAQIGKGKMKSLFSKANEIFSWGRFQKKGVARE